MSSRYAVRQVTWRDARPALAAVRRAVFIEEQHVPEDLEWDEQDDDAVHVLAEAADGTPIGTGRLIRSGRIGRMAVLAQWRGQGVGRAILTVLLEAARAMGHSELRLHAQTHAMAFYARAGFAAHGETFMEAGIPHREMVLRQG